MIFMISIVFIINIPKDSIFLFQTKLIFDGILPIHVCTILRHIGDYVIILYHLLVSYKEKKNKPIDHLSMHLHSKYERIFFLD